METINQRKLQPTFDGSYGNGWKVMGEYFLVLLITVILLGIIVSPTQIFRINLDGSHHYWNWEEFTNFNFGRFAVFGTLAIVLGIFMLAYTLLVVPVFKYGADMMFVHAVRGTRPQFETLVSGFKENYLYIVFASLLKMALVMLSLVFCIVPGIVVACRLVFVSYLVMDKKLDPIIAIEESWKMTRGYGWTIFLMGLISFFIHIFGFLLLFFGIIPAQMWVKSSFASMYQAVLQEKGNGNGKNE
ncbi:MAG: hypothetical protein JXB00_10190 [Bacteroidales bacterium]|nr:hypothetical protein [Bacteroidales bacterium]